MTGFLLATGCPFQWQHPFVIGVPCWICQSVANPLPVKILLPFAEENFREREENRGEAGTGIESERTPRSLGGKDYYKRL
jgi:hypothetical protein